MLKFFITTSLLLAPLLAFTQQKIGSTSGEIKGPFVWKSNIYPGTERNYWVYVPTRYDASKPACLMVVQDGLSRAKGWNLPAVLDSLISEKIIPVQIGVFVDHGSVPTTADAYPRYNRSFEYDALGDRYSRFLLEELLPEVSKSYNISADPNDRSIAGASSGAICAFNVAWERPDQFRRVLSTIGTYVGLRGGDEFVTLVRKTESKPLRVFLQDGTKDLDIYAGDWWMANQSMLSALTWAGYEVNHAWGEGGGHDSKHTITILADALTWLWKDYPQPVQTHKGKNQRINLLLEGESWKEIPLNNMKAGKLAVDEKGDVFFGDKQSIYKVDHQGVASPYARLKEKGEAGSMSFSRDGRLYVVDVRQHKIVAIDNDGVVRDVLYNVDADFLTVSANGIYFSETSKDRIGFYSFSKRETQYSAVPFHPSGLAISAEQTLLNVGAANHVFGYSFKIMDDGSLKFGQEYIHYHIPYGNTSAAVAGLAIDAENLLYSATPMGVQVSDQLGRINFIFSKPMGGITDVKFGGSNLDILYTSCSGKLFSRKINAKGTFSWASPVKPPKPGL